MVDLARTFWRSGLWLLPLSLLLASAAGSVAAAEAVGGRVPNPGTDLWRAVREGPPPGVASSQMQGTGSATLIAEAGQKWRIARQEYLIPWGGWLMAVVLGLILVFHMSRKRPESTDGGGQIQRFHEYQRILHWFMGGVFIFLGLTGLTLLLGRFLLLPLVGPEAFGAIASAFKEGHNLFGPVFILSLVLFFVRFVSRNWYERGDLKWFAKGGGMFGGEHPSAGFFNAGEKLLFWAVALVGAALCVSGVVLLFPQFGQTRELMQDALLVHGIGAVMLITFIFGHIYLATVGVPGSLSGMNTGKVYANWARQHHDRWYRECEEQGLVEKQKN